MFIKATWEKIQHWWVHEQRVDIAREGQETGWEKGTVWGVTYEDCQINLEQRNVELSRVVGKRKESDHRDEHSRETVQVIAKWAVENRGEPRRRSVGALRTDTESNDVGRVVTSRSRAILQADKVIRVSRFEISQLLQRPEDYCYERLIRNSCQLKWH